MNKININKGRNLMKTMAAVVLVGMSTAGCVDMDLSPNGKPAEGNVWSTPTLAEQTIAGHSDSQDRKSNGHKLHLYLFHTQTRLYYYSHQTDTS